MRAGVAQVARCMKTLMPRPLHTSLWHEDPKVTMKQLVSSDWALVGRFWGLKRKFLQA